MKKLLILAGVLAISTASMSYAETTSTVTQQKKPTLKTEISHRPQRPPVDFKKKQAEFEKRLKLTDEQKVKAKELRQKGHEEMKPIIEKIKEKHAQIETVKLSRISVQAQEEKIQQLKKEIGALKREAHELRMKNMKEFESILTKKQLKELEKIKKEGRKKFEKEHKNGPKPGFEHRPMPPKPPVEK